MKRTFAYLMTAFVATAMTVTSCSPIKDAPDKKDTVEFVGTLNGSQEVPSNSSAATGTMTGTYNKVTKELSYTINYTGLTPTAGHFHLSPGGPGVNGGVIIPFSSLTSPITGKSTLKQDQENALMEGRLYVNLHTAALPAGEIRADVKRKAL
ncbi:CHRD domain-containing protein [Larkinella terrae]|uniref:CHRD domain-containing protein n=1 Tax=Larkinella terrae TaxID=2025311 RepID=A0A7K0EMF4_9BACT|nr:CHRD domain-containing protein [Larkinella terrae]MRS62666.1 CHRD domain-containing protein [Larkinella terrae]